MTMKEEFDFEIRDELKKMSEFKSLSKTWPWMMLKWLRTQPVTVQMFIDMVTYSSRGDLDTAVQGLRTSKHFVDRCVDFLDFGLFDEQEQQRYFRRCYEWLFHIWRQEFIKTKCFIDWDYDVSDEQEPCHKVLEDEMVSINALDNLEMGLDARLHYINDRSKVFRDGSLHYNELWMDLKA